MPLDIQTLRDPQGVKEVKESQRRRFKRVEDVDRILDLDKEWRNVTHERDMTAGAIRAKTKNFKDVKDDATAAEALKEEVKKLKATLVHLDAKVEEKQKEREVELNKIGNLVHDSVPVSQDEKDNLIVATWGKCQRTGTEKHHHELMYMIDGYDSPRGVTVAGHRGYFLKGVGVMLNQALINYGLAFLTNRKYTALQPPYFMNKDVMAETAQLEQFDEELYKVSTGVPGEEKYLIATSEQPISAFHRGEWLEAKQVPLRYAGLSSCFRKEAGSHGRDAWGIFRIHQFEKVEQFCITAPEDSWKMHEEMIQASQDFYRSLGLAYRVVNIVSGELNNAASKKYDLEAWFPTLGVFRELVSCSNCTDYQARAMETRFGVKKASDSQKVYAHMLNATLTATERTICCILENYQTDKGIVVPSVLVPYMGGMKFIPFVQGPPTNITKAKQEKAAAAAAKDEEDSADKPAEKTEKAEKADKAPKEKKPKEKKGTEEASDKSEAKSAAAAPAGSQRAPSPAVKSEARAPSPAVKQAARAPSPAVKSAGAAPAAAAGDDLGDQITRQGNIVRDLKSNKAPKDQIDAAVKVLLELKAKLPGGGADPKKASGKKK